MRNIAHLGSRRGIPANLVYPGLVDTPNGRSPGAGGPSRGKGRGPFGRQGRRGKSPMPCCSFCRMRASTSPHRRSPSTAA